jgi:hypothetical protein
MDLAIDDLAASKPSGRTQPGDLEEIIVLNRSNLKC